MERRDSDLGCLQEGQAERILGGDRVCFRDALLALFLSKSQEGEKQRRDPEGREVTGQGKWGRPLSRLQQRAAIPCRAAQPCLLRSRQTREKESADCAARTTSSPVVDWTMADRPKYSTAFPWTIGIRNTPAVLL